MYWDSRLLIHPTEILKWVLYLPLASGNEMPYFKVMFSHLNAAKTTLLQKMLSLLHKPGILNFKGKFKTYQFLASLDQEIKRQRDHFFCAHADKLSL